MTTVFLTLPEIPEESHHVPPIYHASTPERAETIYFMYGTGTFPIEIFYIKEAK